jgi:hypothetical protein
LRLLHCFDGLALDAVDQLFVGGNVVDEANDLTSSPYLSLSASHHYERSVSAYTKVLVAIQEHLTSSFSTDIFGNFLELAGCALLLDIDCLQRDLVGEES